MMTVQDSSVRDVLGDPRFAGLVEEYIAESATPGMPVPVANRTAYEALEAGGFLHVMSALVDGDLVGFIFVLVGPQPRYAVPIAMSESFFVAKAHRKSGAGLGLLRAAEDKTRALGSKVLVVGTPVEGDLFHVLPRVGYTESARMFFKRVSDD